MYIHTRGIAHLHQSPVSRNELKRAMAGLLGSEGVLQRVSRVALVEKEVRRVETHLGLVEERVLVVVLVTRAVEYEHVHSGNEKSKREKLLTQRHRLAGSRSFETRVERKRRQSRSFP